MTLQLELDSQTEAKLIDRAARAGVDVAGFVERLIQSTEDQADGLVDKYDEILDNFFSTSRSTGPDTATYSRRDLYEDHD